MKEKLLSGFTGIKYKNVEAILNECEKQGVTDPAQVAYILATARHETGGSMQPCKEYGLGKTRPYGQRVWYNRRPYTDVPHIYYGRGHTQNTWRDNYKALTNAAKKQGYSWDFENEPDLLLEVFPSAWATVFAMKTGLYTGRKLAKYINNEQRDFLSARRIINGVDQAKRIAAYAEEYLTLLK